MSQLVFDFDFDDCTSLAYRHPSGRPYFQIVIWRAVEGFHYAIDAMFATGGFSGQESPFGQFFADKVAALAAAAADLVRSLGKPDEFAGARELDLARAWAEKQVAA